MKEINRTGLYCTKHNGTCETVCESLYTYKHCEGGVRCDCPACQHMATITNDGKRAIKEIDGGFEQIRIMEEKP